VKNYVVILLFLFSINVTATVFKVGNSREYKVPSDVMSLVNNGDTVEIDAGNYGGDVGIWHKNNLLIRGVGGFVELDAPADLPQQKAIWIVQGNDCVIEYIKFTNAKVPDKNGAGIRFEGTNLTVRHCLFINNEDGILAGKNLESTITVEFSVFGYNGYGNGFSHNIYIGNIKKFIFRYNYTHHAKSGHCIKSRAQENIILYNRIMDEIDGYSSYLINLPNGGVSYIACNLLMQGKLAENSKMIDYGSEGYENPVNNLYIYNNTLVNKRLPGIYINVVKGAGEVVISNNIFTGYNAYAMNVLHDFADTSNNYHEENIEKLGFVDEKHYDYHLTENSPVIDKGGSVPQIPGIDNFLQVEYKHPADSIHINLDGHNDVGAYQYQKPNTSVSGKKPNDISSFYNDGMLYVELPEVLSNSGLEIYNMQGVKIREISLNTGILLNVDVGDLPNGVYLYVLKNKTEIRTGHFLKY